MGINDIAYKEFFSDPQNVADLLRYFVKKDYIKELDYSSLERSNSDFVRKNTKEKLDKFKTFLRFLRRYVGAKFKKEVPNEFKNMEEAINMTRDFAAMERAKGKLEVILAMKNNGKSAEQIAEFIGWDINEILPIYNNKPQNSLQGKAVN